MKYQSAKSSSPLLRSVSQDSGSENEDKSSRRFSMVSQSSGYSMSDSENFVGNQRELVNSLAKHIIYGEILYN